MVPFRDDRGFGLIEVMVSALLTVLIAGAVLTGFETASNASGNTKAQAIASNLAQEDQERMRSLPVEKLLAANPPQVSVVDGVDYTVTSQGVALKNADGAAGCTSGGSGLVKIVSTVRWPGLVAERRPVRIASLVARPFVSSSLKSGSALLILRNADDQPVSGQLVNLLGPSPGTATTDAEGCAYFPNLPAGSYAFNYRTTGWVDPDGVTDIAIDFSVAAQQLTTQEKSYDRGGSVRVAAVQSRVARRANPPAPPVLPPAIAPGAPPGAPFTSVAPKIRFANGSTSLTFNPSASPLGLLYPFPTDYAVHTGFCNANGGLTPADVVSLGAAYSQKVRIQRGAVASPIKLFQPALDPRVSDSGGNPSAGARVIFTPTDPTCGPAIVRGLTRSDGRLLDRDLGLPYGSYSVCATFRNRNTGPLISYFNVDAVSNTQIDGRALELPLMAAATAPPAPSTCTG